MTRRRLGFVATVVAVIAVALAASRRDARGDGALPPDAIVPRLEALRPGYVGLETSFGYLEAQDGHTFTWICHDTLLPSGSGVAPIYVPSPDGTHILASVRQLTGSKNPNGSLYDSPDAGCSWNAIHSIDGVVVVDIAWDPARPLRAIVAAANATTANALWATSDGGATFAPIAGTSVAQTFRTVRFAPGAPSTVYATSQDATAGTAEVWRSSNGGVSWTASPFDYLSQYEVYVAAVSPTDARVVWVRTYDLPESVLRSTDGGITFTPATGTPLAPEDVGIETDGLPAFASSRHDGTFVARDGLTFTNIAGGPHGRGFAWDARGEWEAADDLTDGYALAVAAVGTTAFTPVFDFTQLTGPKSCPAGTDVATVCPPLWPAMEVKLGITTPVPSPSPSPSPTPAHHGGGGCGCDLGDGTATKWGIAIAALVALGALLAQRGRRGR